MLLCPLCQCVLIWMMHTDSQPRSIGGVKAHQRAKNKHRDQGALQPPPVPSSLAPLAAPAPARSAHGPASHAMAEVKIDKGVFWRHAKRILDAWKVRVQAALAAAR
jgi:hypothetical protein